MNSHLQMCNWSKNYADDMPFYVAVEIKLAFWKQQSQAQVITKSM